MVCFSLTESSVDSNSDTYFNRVGQPVAIECRYEKLQNLPPPTITWYKITGSGRQKLYTYDSQTHTGRTVRVKVCDWVSCKSWACSIKYNKRSFSKPPGLHCGSLRWACLYDQWPWTCNQKHACGWRRNIWMWRQLSCRPNCVQQQWSCAGESSCEVAEIWCKNCKMHFLTKCRMKDLVQQTFVIFILLVEET